MTAVLPAQEPSSVPRAPARRGGDVQERILGRRPSEATMPMCRHLQVTAGVAASEVPS